MKNKENKKINFIFKNKILFKYNCIICEFSIIIIILFQKISNNNLLAFIEYKSSNITLKIKGTGYKDVFYWEINYYPNTVYKWA